MAPVRRRDQRGMQDRVGDGSGRNTGEVLPRAGAGAVRRLALDAESGAGPRRKASDAKTSAFESLRPRLFGIAYRMTGSRADAEDAVQETWLRYAGMEKPVRSVDGFLVTTVTRLCIDHLRSGRVRREEYVGPWLPEPLPTFEEPETEVERMEVLSTALLRVIERLEPLERAVFLLREVFGYNYSEVAAMVGRREDHCRQLVHRARRRLRSERPGAEASVEEHRRLLEGFLQASVTGDLGMLESLLLDDVVLLADSGGTGAVAQQPVQGRRTVARFIAGVTAQASPEARMDLVELNGLPGALLRDHQCLQTALSLDARDGGIAAVFMWQDPEKLRGLVECRGQPFLPGCCRVIQDPSAHGSGKGCSG